MKRITLAIVLCLFVALFPMTVSAAAPASSLTGPSAIRAGDTLTISVYMNGSGLESLSGEIRYDAAQLTFNSIGSYLAGWDFGAPDSSVAGKVTFLAIDNALSAPINSNSRIFVLTFTVKSAVAVGSAVTISTASLQASDGNTDFTPANATYSKTVAAPLSTNNALSSLTVSNATIAPAFAAGTTSYTATVPFDTAKLTLAATAADAKAKVVINNKDLAAGGVTAVTVVVTAENGAKKTYTINVTRAADPSQVTTAPTAEPTVEPTVEPTSEPTATLAPTATPTPGVTATPTPTSGNDPSSMDSGTLILLFILTGILCLAIGFGGGWLVTRRSIR